MEIDQPRPEITTLKKKCHGNRKLYHFKRKCRSRGMTEEQITALINTRNNEQHQTNDAGSTVVLPNRHQLEQKKQQRKKRPNKRKQAERKDEEHNRMNKSMSQLSVSQQSRPKKLKTNEDEGTIVSTIPSNLM
jgi:flagellar biosynthesis GTPase FlhF